jgi:hypothetical protein
MNWTKEETYTLIEVAILSGVAVCFGIWMGSQPAGWMLWLTGILTMHKWGRK